MKNSNQNPGLYIHVPFCGSKCAYCDFYSVTDRNFIVRWLQALKKEIGLYQNDFAPFDTLYLGGGTPSILPDAVLAELTDFIKTQLPFSPAAEITLEANPDDLSLAKLKLFQDLGFNRLSLGVQSFDEDILKFLGRRHTARQAVHSLDWARTAGFNNITVDLMYAIPGQNAKAWYKNLQQALKFKPEHLSCYQLTLEPSTPLGQLVEQNRLQLWDEDNARLFFLETSLALAAAGYVHYEISNFAGDPDHFSRHNLKYWQHVPYLGLGPAAHSFLGNKRWWNIRNLEKYCEALNQGQAPLEESEDLTQAQWQLETLYLGFRTNRGVDLELLKDYPNHGTVLKQLRESSLIHEQDGRIIPTREGFVVADSLPLLFQ
ncbi:MAG: radical SAM family heme chaperone HemW [Desulfobacteraceae bacterium]|nr:MAG: radical SAM family heme chaperone HemW [Desulfobacteraceae bacterium]